MKIITSQILLSIIIVFKIGKKRLENRWENVTKSKNVLNLNLIKTSEKIIGKREKAMKQNILETSMSSSTQ